MPFMPTVEPIKGVKMVTFFGMFWAFASVADKAGTAAI